jgi:hypothetical protein
MTATTTQFEVLPVYSSTTKSQQLHFVELVHTLKVTCSIRHRHTPAVAVVQDVVVGKLQAPTTSKQCTSSEYNLCYMMASHLPEPAKCAVVNACACMVTFAFAQCTFIAALQHCAIAKGQAICSRVEESGILYIHCAELNYDHGYST